MSREPAAQDVEELKETVPEVENAFAVLTGSVVVFVGALVIFSASPAISVDPVFGFSSIEPVSVMANMAVGTSITVSGAAMVIPNLDDLL